MTSFEHFPSKELLVLFTWEIAKTNTLQKISTLAGGTVVAGSTLIKALFGPLPGIFPFQKNVYFY